jgi:3-hydroxyacyl-[acyl-carrier protein] dehydratase / trans-2-decenoyl-[acyl-carrier protein] isomerase
MINKYRYTHEEWLYKTELNTKDLEAVINHTAVDPKTLPHGEWMCKIPDRPIMCMDRVYDIKRNENLKTGGSLKASFEVKPNQWFFKTHFTGDPVMPGSLGLDNLWQMMGLFGSLVGCIGKGRALGGSIKFVGEVLPTSKLVEYYVNISKVVNRKRGSMIYGEGTLSVDGTQIYTATDLMIGMYPPEKIGITKK